MIAKLSGKLLEAQDGLVLLDVGGVGYELEVPSPVLEQLAQQLSIDAGEADTGSETTDLFTHMVVREDAQLLFGFLTRADRDLFRAYIKINGVGPKLALSLISELSPQQLIEVVRSSDPARLTKVPGVGKKTAERLMLELKSRLDQLVQSSAEGGDVARVKEVALPLTQDSKTEAQDALVALGYKPNEAQLAVEQVYREVPDANVPMDVGEVVRLALRGIARKG